MHAKKFWIWLAIAAGVLLLLSGGQARAIDAGINVDIRQDLNLPTAQLPNGFQLKGRIESGLPGGAWGQPPVLTDHYDGPFVGFTPQIVNDPDPAQNWFQVTCTWVGQPVANNQVIHLGVFFNATCHNVVIEVTGRWMRNGLPIGTGLNHGFVPIPGFRVLDTEPQQFLHVQNGDLDTIVDLGEIEMRVISAKVFAVENKAQLTSLLGPMPYHELRSGGLESGVPWVPVANLLGEISPINPINLPVGMPDSFFDVFLSVPGPYFPIMPQPVPPGGFLLAKQQIEFVSNTGMIDQRWVWEVHEAHQADLGDAPDSTNSWGAQMTAYPAGGPPGVVANFPTVYQIGSPPWGPMHLQPQAVAWLGQTVTLEMEADIGPDQDVVNNIQPVADTPNTDVADDGVQVPLTLPHCTSTTFPFTVTVANNPVAVPLFVNVWFDWNRDADWDDGFQCPDGSAAPEWAVQNQPIGVLAPGPHVITSNPFVPYNLTPGQSQPIWMRIMVAEQPWAPSGVGVGYAGGGPAQGYAYGETEDYYFTPLEPVADDFGDAPAPYPTKIANNGAQHGQSQLWLGNRVDYEADGQPTPLGDGDDLNPLGPPSDEDGVSFVTPLAVGQPATIQVILNPALLTPALLSAWVDFNGDGNWGTAGDQIYVAQPIFPGPNLLTFIVPPTATPNITTFARFRVHTNPGGIAFTGRIPYGEVEDHLVHLVSAAKWSQLPHGNGAGFDGPSDLWYTPGGAAGTKWIQTPSIGLPGLHAHDYSDLTGMHRITLADDWQCQGGLVSDFHWWGNYELMQPGVEWRGSGISAFQLSIHPCAGPGAPWCLPMDPPILPFTVSFASVHESDTGLVNSEGCRIYYYTATVVPPFPQQQGTWYWFDVTAKSVDPTNPPHWRWQEARRDLPPPLGHAPAASRLDANPWQTITWTVPAPTRYSDMAFVVSTNEPGLSVNRVIADDFISDGRPINGLRWWGSYLDPRYAPGPQVDPFHVIDGWLISFHGPNPADPQCPRGADDAQGMLGVYFAPASAVTISATNTTDCNGQAVYQYNVDLAACCLLCAEPDSRNGLTPAQDELFREQPGLTYWLDIQAVVGAKWTRPQTGGACAVQYTGHLPSDLAGLNGHFWGWHTSPANTPPYPPLQTACVGRITSFNELPPECWEYGEWVKQPWLCPTTPQPVQMAFELLTTVLPEIQACCLPDGSCLDISTGDCIFLHNGTPRGAGTNCAGLSPSIVQNLTSSVVCEGDSASLSVIACGTPPLTYRWYHDGLLLPTVIGPTLFIPAAALSDAGVYTVTVSNAHGAAGAGPATLTVWDRGSGDANLSGTVNGLDIQPFVHVVLGVIGDAHHRCVCDMNGDGSVNALDVGPLVTRLLAP